MATTYYKHSQLPNPSAPVALASDVASEQPVLSAEHQRIVTSFERAFDQPFSVVDGSSGRVVHTAADWLNCDFYSRLGLCEEVARRGRPEILEDVSPLFLLGIPLPADPLEPPLLAVSIFVTDANVGASQLESAAGAFGVSVEEAQQWAAPRTPWHPQAAVRMSTAIVEKLATQQSSLQLKKQVAEVSSHLLNTFEEITLLHRLTEHLSLSKSVVELCELSVRWLADVIPANCMAIKLNSVVDMNDRHGIDQNGERGPLVINNGDCPLAVNEFDRFMERLGPHVATEPLVLNRAATSSPTWFYPQIRELISVPVREGDHLFGWLLAFNHTGSGEVTNSEVEFGTVEASLMSSVATILGIHSGNIALYHEQAEFFASVVRALTSAIDAKDPYTCGHSDRVARLAVVLARRMGCSTEEIDTIYLSGLLHDIGKIGIDDNVLRKPGALTDEELEHIKTHPELGYKILNGVKQLDKVLPVVLHHHEAWDGAGYPAGLKAEECPLLARIVAVADSIDAMSSDRPYRKGIPDEKLDKILRDGAGRQWDPQVVNAVFQVRDELRHIGESDREPLSLDVTAWRTQMIGVTG